MGRVIHSQGNQESCRESRRGMGSVGLGAAAVMLAFGLVPQDALSQTVSFEGKSVTISVGYGPGGGADTMARVLAVHLSRNLPGSPRIVVENRPGGGTQTNARDMLRRPTDGTYIGQFAQSLMMADAIGKAPDWFNWSDYKYLGMVDGAAQDGFWPVCARADRIKNLEDFKNAKEPLRWGEISSATGAGRDLKWFSLTDFPIRAYFGFGGSAEVAAAFDRGEMDLTGRCSEQEALRFPEWFSENRVVPLFAWGTMDPDKHVPSDNPISNGIRENRWPWFGDVRETMREFATPDQWAAFDAMFSMHGTHVWAMPPGVPDHVHRVVHDVFWDTINSKAFVDDMLQRNRPVYQLSGDQLVQRLEDVRNLPAGAMAFLQEVFTD